MNPEEIADWIVDYDLSEKLEFVEYVTNSDTINFKLLEKYIIGFKIIIRNSTMKNAERKGNNKAKNLKNILIAKSGMPIEVNLKSLQSIPRLGHDTHVMGTFTIRTGGIRGAVDKLDLNENNIQSVINSSEPESLKYEYLSKGIFYKYNLNSIDCIKELFRVIENIDTFPSYNKYKVIRNMFSHRVPYTKETIELFKICFNPNPFECKKFEPENGWIIIDMESNKNQRLLNKIASELVSEVKKYLRLQ